MAQLVPVDDEPGRAPGRIACACGEVVAQLVCGELLIDLELPRSGDGRRRTYRALVSADGGAIECPSCNRRGTLDVVLRQSAALTSPLELAAA